ncbi:MAG: DNA-directed RNA polymerase subunit omega [Armatimonadetes bacterium]|nr:DNA-directed RNA polymerase subunit omega [Armatimonadota bacterium]
MLHDESKGLGNKFALVTLTMKRARQINDGSKVLVDVDVRKPVSQALFEIYDNKVRIRDKSKEPQRSVSQEDAQAAALAAALGTPGGGVAGE